MTTTAGTAQQQLVSPGAQAKVLAPIVAIGLVLTVVAQLIGPHVIQLPFGKISLYPLIWGLVLGGLVSMQRVKPLPVRLQHTATHVVEIAILLLAARLSFLVGENLPVLAKAGPALLLQEFGHLLGTVIFALPLAVLLRMGRATVGATFSIDREGSFAMVSERYGPDSDEYRGVLSMYVFGTLFGALYVGLLASVLADNGVFDPLALAMGAGVGSGSMMAASSAAIAAAYPQVAEQVLAMAAVSNLITTVLGLYVGMYVALPLADRLYRKLTRTGPVAQPAERAKPVGNAGTAHTGHTASASASEAELIHELEAAGSHETRTSRWVTLPAAALAMLVSVVLFNGGFEWGAVVGLLVMTATVLVAQLLNRLTKLSTIIGVSTIGMVLSSPWSPVAHQIDTLLKPIEFLALTTSVLVFAGLGLGKDAHLLKRIGWRIVPVGIVSLTASFVAAAAIAQVALKLG